MIRQLDEQLIAKIAAGEVIERPASVIKELVENALDAQSTQIIVRIKEGGKLFMSVTDNGVGIPADELPLALQRHATSKITSLDDLFAIHTLGFRGEALASIAAVSDCTVISKPAAQQTAMQIRDGVCSPAAHDDGTTIAVHNLFGRVPARLKYLKTPSTEQRYIHAVLHHYALCYPTVSWKFFADGALVFSVPVQTSLLERAGHLYGKAIGKHMISFEQRQGPVRIQGVLAKPPIMRANRKDQIFFCNKRLMQSAMVSSALEQACAGLFPSQKYPLAVVLISVDPQEVDVNVHPAKTTVKFVDESTVYRAVYHTVKDALHTKNLLQEPEQHTFSSGGSASVSQMQTQQEQVTHSSKKSYGYDVHTQQPLAVNEGGADDDVPPFRILEIIDKTYVIASCEQGVTVTDFHAAYERLNYEVFKRQHAQNGIQTQSLLSPYIYETSALAHRAVLEHKDDLATLGFIIDDFGPQTIQVTHVPLVLGRQVSPAMIDELAGELVDGKSTAFHKKTEDWLARMACKASPRAGDTVSFEEARQLIRSLYKEQLTWTCPHGRPVMVLLSPEYFAKLFKRS